MELISAIRSKLGEFWWYSALIFLAARFGDAINLFIGLWLVPKFVSPQELGAVLPLTSFATSLALPISIFGLVFMRRVNILAMEGKRGQLKSLLRSVFVIVGVLLFLMIVLSAVISPLVFERIRVSKGSLGILVIATGFLGTVAPVYTNALQALKKFRSISLMHILGAPIRLVVMLITMPIRALAGYFTAQSAMSLWQIFLSVFTLRKELGSSVPIESYWTRENIRAMLRYLFFVTLYFLPTVTSFIETMIIRQRLSDVDSAAYYMISRFGEVGVYAAGAILTVLFPYVSEAEAKKDKKVYKLIYSSTLASIAFGLICACFFYFFGGRILSLFPNGGIYSSYAPQMAILTMILCLGATLNCTIVGFVAEENFRFLWWWLPFHAVYGLLLLFITGYGYLENILPANLIDVLKTINSYGLNFILVTMLLMQLCKLVFVFLPFNKNRA